MDDQKELRGTQVP